MPASLFKSRPKPKSDPRLQWKALKAKHAKTISVSKVEVGLGKALDAHQKEVDAIMLLDGNQLTAQAFAPVLATAAKVKSLVTGLEPKVKGNDDYTAFLTALKKDADWWPQAAKDVTTAPAQLSDSATETLTKALSNMQLLNTCVIQLNTMLKVANTKTKTYTPPAEVPTWLAQAEKLKPMFTRLSVLSKNRTGNFKLIVQLLRANQADISLLGTRGMHLASTQRDNPGLQPVVNWDEVESAGRDAERAGRAADRAIGQFKDRDL